MQMLLLGPRTYCMILQAERHHSHTLPLILPEQLQPDIGILLDAITMRVQN